MEYDVTIDRDSYIGGSDIPAIMGISPFKTRYQLLLEKAGIEKSDFTGNKYTVYGQQMESLIRDYINDLMHKGEKYTPNRVIVGDFRAHTDGFNGKSVLEIKTTSHIYDKVDDYKIYLVQLLKYMEVNKVSNGVLAVYERNPDFSVDFDFDRLYLYEIKAEDYGELLAEINFEIDRFRADLKRLKENPLLTEADFMPPALAELSGQIVQLENQIAMLKKIEKQCDDAKKALFRAMVKHDVKSWTMPNGTKITRVDGTPGAVEKVEEFNLESFKRENPYTYELYVRLVEKKKSGRAGYVKITPAK